MPLTILGNWMLADHISLCHTLVRIRTTVGGNSVNAVVTTLAKVNAPLKKLQSFGPIVLRLTLGIVLFWHGCKKFNDGISGVKGFFTYLNIPVPGFAAYVVALLELIGGILIVVGLATRFVSLLFIIELLVAVFVYKYGKAHTGLIAPDPKGAGAELDWALIAGFVALALGGAGTASLDQRLGIDRAA
jgi:putative oxidoreductase